MINNLEEISIFIKKNNSFLYFKYLNNFLKNLKIIDINLNKKVIEQTGGLGFSGLMNVGKSLGSKTINNELKNNIKSQEHKYAKDGLKTRSRVFPQNGFNKSKKKELAHNSFQNFKKIGQDGFDYFKKKGQELAQHGFDNLKSRGQELAQHGFDNLKSRGQELAHNFFDNLKSRGQELAHNSFENLKSYGNHLVAQGHDPRQVFEHLKNESFDNLKTQGQEFLNDAFNNLKSYGDHLLEQGFHPDHVLEHLENYVDQVHHQMASEPIENHMEPNNQYLIEPEMQHDMIEKLPDTYVDNPGFTSDKINTYTIIEGTILYHASTQKKGFNTNNIMLGNDNIISFFTPNFRLASDNIGGCNIDKQNGYIHVFRVIQDIPNIFIKLPYDMDNNMDLSELSNKFCSGNQKFNGIGFFYPQNNIKMFSNSFYDDNDFDYYSEFGICNPNPFLEYLYTQNCMSLRKLSEPYRFY